MPPSIYTWKHISLSLFLSHFLSFSGSFLRQNNNIHDTISVTGIRRKAKVPPYTRGSITFSPTLSSSYSLALSPHQSPQGVACPLFLGDLGLRGLPAAPPPPPVPRGPCDMGEGYAPYPPKAGLLGIPPMLTLPVGPGRSCSPRQRMPSNS